MCEHFWKEQNKRRKVTSSHNYASASVTLLHFHGRVVWNIKREEQRDLGPLEPYTYLYLQYFIYYNTLLVFPVFETHPGV